MALILLFIWLKFSIKFSYELEKNIILYSLFPVFLDWVLTGVHIIKSNNTIRFISGLVAGFGLSRWWYLWMAQYHLDIFYSIAKIYIISIGLFFLVMAYRQKTLKWEFIFPPDKGDKGGYRSIE